MDNTNTIFEKKIVLAGVTVILSTILAWFGHIQPANFQEIVIWVVGLTVAGDTANVWASYFSNQTAKTEAPTKTS